MSEQVDPAHECLVAIAKSRQTDAQRLEQIRANWEHDMEHPFSVSRQSDGTYKAEFADGRIEVRSEEEAINRPWLVSFPRSDIEDVGFLLAQLDEAKQTIAELRESRQVIYDRAIQHENTISEKDAEIERLRKLLEIVTDDRDAHKRLAQDFALGR